MLVSSLSRSRRSFSGLESLVAVVEVVSRRSQLSSLRRGVVRCQPPLLG